MIGALVLGSNSLSYPVRCFIVYYGQYYSGLLGAALDATRNFLNVGLCRVAEAKRDVVRMTDAGRNWRGVPEIEVGHTAHSLESEPLSMCLNKVLWKNHISRVRSWERQGREN